MCNWVCVGYDDGVPLLRTSQCYAAAKRPYMTGVRDWACGARVGWRAGLGGERIANICVAPRARLLYLLHSSSM